MALVTQTFSSSTTWTVPAGVALINKVLIVSGGGGGGNNRGGGGGGGRVRYEENVVVTPGGSVTVTVGNGGIASANGESSAFGAFSITGGSAGADNLGSGGSSLGGTGGAPSAYAGGGGASAVSPGQAAGDYPGVGANGYYWNVTGQYYGGGGQGGSDTETQYGVDIPAEVSQGGGAAGGGATNTNPANAGTNGLGGGGGGARVSGTGGAGGKGVVIIQYYEPEYEVTADKTGVAEGETITFTLRTRNVPNGTVVNYVLSGTGVASGDFSGGLNGTFTVSSLDDGANGTATSAKTLVNDSTEEGNEVVTLTVVGPGDTLTFTVGDSNIGTIANPESITIRTSDYNDIQSRLAAVLGTGSGNSGWGQTVQSSQVATGNKVTVNEYAALKKDIIGAYRHIYGSDPSLVDATVSSKVRANALTAPYKQYLTYVNIIEARKLEQPPVSQSVTNNHGSKQYTSTWTEYLTSTVTVSFSSGDQARYFFNSGGELRFTSGRTGGATNQHNTTWTTLLTTAGTQAFGGAKPSQGTSPDDGTNYHKLTTSYQPWYEASASSPYAENTYRISARLVSTGNPKDIEFKIEWVDDYTAGGTEEDDVDGTLTIAVTSLKPDGFLEPTSAGSFAIETPTVSISNISATGGATYTIVPSATQVLEGDLVTFTISGSGITDGSYAYEIIGISANDVTDATLQGTVNITSNNGSFSKRMNADRANENNETFRVELRDANTTVATSNNVTIYNVKVIPTAGIVVEGGSVTFNISGTVIPADSYTYAIGGGVTSADFTDNALTGSVSISSNAGSVTKTLATDGDSAAENFYLDFKKGSYILARSSEVTVNERSNVDLYGAASYQFSPDGNQVSSGNAGAGAGLPGSYNSSTYGDVIWPNSGSWVGTIITPNTSSVTFEFACDNTMDLWINNTRIIQSYTNFNSWTNVTRTVIPGQQLYISISVANFGGPFGLAGRVINGGTTFTKTKRAAFDQGGWRSS